MLSGIVRAKEERLVFRWERHDGVPGRRLGFE